MNRLQSFSNSPVKASSNIETDVVNREGEGLGDIKEAVIDPGSGKVAYAVVAFGGFPGMGEYLFATPFNAFEYNMEDNEHVLDTTRERLNTTPGFDADHWTTMSDEKWNRDIYKYYARSTYWE